MQNGSAATNAIYNIEASNLHQHLYNLRSVAPKTQGSVVATKLLLALKLPPVFAAPKLYYCRCKVYSCSGCKHALTETPPWLWLCHNTDIPPVTPGIGLCHKEVIPSSVTPGRGLCHNTVIPSVTPGLRLCHSTVIPSATSGLGMCHKEVIPSMTPGLGQRHNK